MKDSYAGERRFTFKNGMFSSHLSCNKSSDERERKSRYCLEVENRLIYFRFESYTSILASTSRRQQGNYFWHMAGRDYHHHLLWKQEFDLYFLSIKMSEF